MENSTSARGHVYELLSLLYGVPGQALIGKGFLAPLRTDLGLCRPGLDRELRELESYLGGLHDVAPLETEYVRLFRGPGRSAVYPYESMHVDGEIMGPSTLSVLGAYRDGGLSPSADFKDLPDHVCAELEFMYYLCVMEQQCEQQRDSLGRASYRQLQDSFLAEHLALWIPGFVERILVNTSSPFYRGLAALTRDFLGFELSRTDALD
ncbi:MAG: molecular chaperone TorD family protein [Dehalococcoidia bacterium]|nr:molecular chaperone TorD family protein [Dehalococcoidia bacterium]